MRFAPKYDSFLKCDFPTHTVVLLMSLYFKWEAQNRLCTVDTAACNWCGLQCLLDSLQGGSRSLQKIMERDSIHFQIP